MAKTDTAHGHHGGPTRLADLQDLDTPRQAPHTLRFSSAMTALMAMQWSASFPGGLPKEQGGTIVADQHGNLSIQNVGGDSSLQVNRSHFFLPDLKVRNAAHFKAVGVFHTHPYGREDGYPTGVSFSGGDMGSLMLGPFLLDVVQSGPRLFAMVKTRQLSNYVDKWNLHKESEETVWREMKAGRTFSQASRVMAAAFGLRYCFAYYQGAHGVLTRI